MADLRAAARRGQLMLVTGFAIAVAIVSLALILNSVIYTENLATRAESTASEPISHTNAVESGTATIIGAVNDYNMSVETDYDTLRDNFTRAFAAYTETSLRQQLRDGQVVDDRIVTSFNGTWIAQNETGPFLNDGGAEDWSPVDNGADGARRMRLYVNDTGELASTTSDAFTLVANDSDDLTWTLRITETAVNVTNATGNSFECTAIGGVSSGWVNVSRGTVAGTPCPGLAVAPSLGPIQAVEFTNGDAIEGTYRFMVNKTESTINSTDFGIDSSVPLKLPALYGATVEVDYERENLVYRTRLRVVPGESDG